MNQTAKNLENQDKDNLNCIHGKPQGCGCVECMKESINGR